MLHNTVGVSLKETHIRLVDGTGAVVARDADSIARADILLVADSRRRRFRTIRYFRQDSAEAV
jgi:hypothetical protein